MKLGLKNPLLRVTNLLLYLSFCALLRTGALLTWKLVPGYAVGAVYKCSTWGAMNGGMSIFGVV